MLEPKWSKKNINFDLENLPEITYNGAEPLLLQLWPGQPEAFAGGERPACGSVRRDKAGLSVACADGWYRLGRVRPPAKKEMDALALCNGLLQKMPLGISGTASRPEA